MTNDEKVISEYETALVQSDAEPNYKEAWNKAQDRIAKLEAILAPAEPVAWRVKDFGAGWILCHSREQAEAWNPDLTQPLYTAPPPGPDASGLIKAAEYLEGTATYYQGHSKWEEGIRHGLRIAIKCLRSRAADRSAK